MTTTSRLSSLCLIALLSAGANDQQPITPQTESIKLQKTMRITLPPYSLMMIEAGL